MMHDGSYVLGGTIRVNEANPKATGCPEMVPVLRTARHDVLSLSRAREVKSPVIGIPEANFLDLSPARPSQSRKSMPGPAEKFRGIFVIAIFAGTSERSRSSRSRSYGELRYCASTDDKHRS